MSQKVRHIISCRNKETDGQNYKNIKTARNIRQTEGLQYSTMKIKYGEKITP